jgi:hypothetical protein
LKGGKRKRNRIGFAKADNFGADKIAEKINAPLALRIHDRQTEKPKPIPFDTWHSSAGLGLERPLGFG